jgi:hypothetical protein
MVEESQEGGTNGLCTNGPIFGSSNVTVIDYW